MPKQHFFMRLTGPRSTFPADMTPAEAALMAAHGAYIHQQFEAGHVLAYGPVLDPAGTFGMGLFEVDSLTQAQHLAEADPSIRAGMNRYTLSPMHLAACQASRE